MRKLKLTKQFVRTLVHEEGDHACDRRLDYVEQQRPPQAHHYLGEIRHAEHRQ